MAAMNDQTQDTGMPGPVEYLGTFERIDAVHWQLVVKAYDVEAARWVERASIITLPATQAPAPRTSE